MPLVPELKKTWKSSAASCALIPLKKAALSDVKVDAQTKDVLLKVGLPDQAAPFLAFEAPWESALPRVEHEGLEHLRVIGTDAVGNPICLDERKKGRVVVLDHEDDFKATAMNTGVAQLLRCLAAYADWHAAVRQELGDDAWDRRLPPAVVSRLAKALQGIDPKGLKAGSFWQAELESY